MSTVDTAKLGGGAPDRPPPIATVGVIGWLRTNLFGSVVDSILTIVSMVIIYYAFSALLDWAVFNAIWEAENRRECLNINKETGTSGACWAGVIIWFNAIIYGRYPYEEQWRINFAFIVLVLWLAPMWMPRVKEKLVYGLSAVVFYPFLGAALFAGGERGLFLQIMMSAAIVFFVYNCVNALVGLLSGNDLPDTLREKLGIQGKSDKAQRNILLAIAAVAFAVVFALTFTWTVPNVTWTKWGGLFLTLVISGIGITAALPGGIVLALGRRSQLPVIRVISVTFIEVFRSVPLITILFMATTMFPLFLPEGFTLNKLLQVIVAVCLFNACYMAEVVRAGLQAIPKGQYEAADAMGLGYWKMMGLVIMPQALKYMIPNIVGNFIGLLKDTTLVSIIGLFDVLNIIQSAISRDVPWRGLHKEPLFVGALIFFIICFAMSKYSQHLERKLSTDHR